MDLSEQRYLFPNCLRSAHQSTSSKVRLKKNEKIDVLLKERVQNELQQFNTERGGYIIRAASSTEELFAEGKALNNCVGSYAEDYALGKTNLFVIRLVEEPDKPLYTCEVWPQSWKVIQLRGYKNQNAPKKIQLLMESFLSNVKEKVGKKKRKIKSNEAVAV
jgi:hypothetical protein